MVLVVVVGGPVGGPVVGLLLEFVFVFAFVRVEVSARAAESFLGFLDFARACRVAWRRSQLDSVGEGVPGGTPGFFFLPFWGTRRT